MITSYFCLRMKYSEIPNEICNVINIKTKHCFTPPTRKKSLLFASTINLILIAWILWTEIWVATVYTGYFSNGRPRSHLFTLCYRWGGVGAVRELVGGDAGHGWGWETPWDQVVECHQLIGSCLLPPPRPPVAEPNLEGQWWKCLISVCVMSFIFFFFNSAILHNPSFVLADIFGQKI